MHQKTPIKYDGFDPGTGHSTQALKGLMDRLKKQYITDAKPGDAIGAAASVTPAANGDAAATAPPTPKKRARPAKKAADGGEKVWCLLPAAIV
jgi:hypothetical protein